MSEKSKAYYQEHKQKMSESAKKWREQNRDKYNEYHRKYYYKKGLVDYHRKYREEHKERARYVKKKQDKLDAKLKGE